MAVVRRLWAVVGCGPMVMDRGSDDCGFDFGLWVVGHGSMVVGGGGGNGLMTVVLVYRSTGFLWVLVTDLLDFGSALWVPVAFVEVCRGGFDVVG